MTTRRTSQIQSAGRNHRVRKHEKHEQQTPYYRRRCRGRGQRGSTRVRTARSSCLNAARMCHLPTADCHILLEAKSPNRITCWSKRLRASKARFNLDVRIKTDVIHVDRPARRIKVRKTEAGREYEEAYDALVLSTGASPLRPPIPGIV